MKIKVYENNKFELFLKIPFKYILCAFQFKKFLKILRFSNKQKKNTKIEI